jgi:hypothetical protein
MMRSSSIEFSIASYAAWAPGVETREAWLDWAYRRISIQIGSEPALRAMPPMQRRRVGFLGKMALEVAYECLGSRTNVPTLFCSRHGEVSRSVDLLRDLASNQPISPTSFGLSVHNAVGGMFSIARNDQANHIALSAGPSTIEHALIEACGLLSDGERAVLLVACDCPLPSIYSDYADAGEQPFAWAWLIEPPRQDVISLSWSRATGGRDADAERVLGGLDILRFQLRRERRLERICGNRLWQWSRNA